MKKNAPIYLFLLVLSLLLPACVIKEKNLFDVSPNERMDRELKAFKELLVGSENGWIMEYYPGKNQEYGGHSFVMRFADNDIVTVFSEKDLSNPQISLYTLKTDMGLSLSFDTYNNFFHYFSSPDINDSNKNLGSGFEGDYEFIFKSSAEQKNEIVLEGKKTGNTIRMYRMKDSPKDYMHKIAASESKLTTIKYLESFDGMVGNKAFSLKYEEAKRFSIMVKNKNGNEVKKYIPYVYTEVGFDLYSAVEANDVSMRRFSFEKEEEGENLFLKCLDPGAEAVELKPVSLVSFLNYEDILGNYTMTYALEPSSQKHINVDVRIVEKEKDKTYTLEGLKFELELTYDPELGTFSICTQKINETPAVFFCATDANKLENTARFDETKTGMIGSWNMSYEDFVIEMRYNGVPIVGYDDEDEDDESNNDQGTTEQAGNGVGIAETNAFTVLRSNWTPHSPFGDWIYTRIKFTKKD